MEEKKEEDLKEKLELLNKLILLSSSLALIGGGLWFLIYSIVIVKDFPRLTEISLFYYIFAIFLFLIFFVTYPLVFYLYFKIIEENRNIDKNDKNIFFRIFRYCLLRNSKTRRLLRNKKNIKLYERIYKLQQRIITNLSFFIYIFTSIVLFRILYQGDSSIFATIAGYIIEYIVGYKMSTYITAPFFVIFQIFLYLYLKNSLERIIIYKDKNALLYNIFTFSSVVIAVYIYLFLTVPFQLLKIGYFEANLTLEKEYVEKSWLKTYLEENCQPECLNKSSNDNYCKFFITCSEKCQTECLDELFKDTQNDNHRRTFKFFIFLRTSSEYIVGCNKNSNVRIHIPSDKVIAIEYIEEDSKKEENKNTPAPQQQTPQQQ
jgi:hypothetical protein